MSAGVLESWTESLRPGDHLCMPFEDSVRSPAIIAAFLKDGLDRGECCLYIPHDPASDRVCAALAAAGVDVARARDDGRFVFATHAESYLQTGSFDPAFMIDFMDETIRRAVASGFTGWRVAGHPTWALGQAPGAERLIEYEARLNEFFSARRACALCCYDQRLFPPGTLIDVLRTHHGVVLDEQLCRVNPYCEPSAVFRANAGEAARLEWMLGRLRAETTQTRPARRGRRVRADAPHPGELEFQRFAETLPQMVWMSDTDGRALWVNGRWGEDARTPLPAGWRWEATVHEDDRRTVEALWVRALETGEPFEAECRLERPGGRPCLHIIRMHPVRDRGGAIVRWVGTFTDIDAVRDTLAAREDADRRRDLFLALLAHDIRESLDPIRIALQVMQMAAGDPRAVARAHGMIARQTDRLITLRALSDVIENVLDVSRLRSGNFRVRREPVEMATIVEQALEVVQPLIDAEGLQVGLRLGAKRLRVEGDLRRLVQVVVHLLDNAIQFSSPGGFIWLRLARRGDSVVLRVRDSGIGIAPALLPRVFEMFVQGDCPFARQRPGLAIRLALVRMIVELHGGRVEARSDGPGRGSELIVRLPALTRDRTRVDDGETIPTARRLRIVVVEGDPVADGSLTRLVARSGCDVRTAVDGPTAVAIIVEAGADLVFVDADLPNLDLAAIASRFP